jgi:hypothetical protein
MRGGFSQPRALSFADSQSSSERVAMPRTKRGSKRLLGEVSAQVGRRVKMVAPSARVAVGEDDVEDLSAFFGACNVPKKPKKIVAVPSASVGDDGDGVEALTAFFDAYDVPSMPKKTGSPKKQERFVVSPPDLSVSPIAARGDLWSPADVGGEEQLHISEQAKLHEEPFRSFRAPVGSKKRGRPKGGVNKRRAEDSFVEVDVSRGVVGPLVQQRDEAKIIPVDALNYQPLLEREDRQSVYPKRVRVLPLAYWRGEKPIYGVRTRDDNVPQVAGYGIVGAPLDEDDRQKLEVPKRKRRRRTFNENVE